MLFVYNAIDDFVMTNLATYNKRRLVSAETKDLDLGDKKKKKKKKMKDKKEGEAGDGEEGEDEEEESDASEEEAKEVGGLSEAEVKDLGAWLVKALPGKLSGVTATGRLGASPCVVTDHESGALRRMMRMVQQQNGGAAAGDLLPPQVT